MAHFQTHQLCECKNHILLKEKRIIFSITIAIFGCSINVLILKLRNLVKTILYKTSFYENTATLYPFLSNLG